MRETFCIVSSCIENTDTVLQIPRTKKGRFNWKSYWWGGVSFFWLITINVDFLPILCCLSQLLRCFFQFSNHFILHNILMSAQIYVAWYFSYHCLVICQALVKQKKETFLSELKKSTSTSTVNTSKVITLYFIPIFHAHYKIRCFFLYCSIYFSWSSSLNHLFLLILTFIILM